MQDEFRRAGTLLLDVRVQSGGFPLAQAGGLARDQIGLHGEVRARQIQGIFIIHCQFKKRR